MLITEFDQKRSDIADSIKSALSDLEDLSSCNAANLTANFFSDLEEAANKLTDEVRVLAEDCEEEAIDDEEEEEEEDQDPPAFPPA